MIIRPLQHDDEERVQRALEALGPEAHTLDFFFNNDGGRPFSDYVDWVNGWAEGKDLPGKFVPSTFLVAVVDDEIVSRVSIRHELNAFLREYGGHIGYHTVPGHEGKGYATALTRHALDFLAARGIEEAFMTCTPENAASRHIIAGTFGGHLQDTTYVELVDETLSRFWVKTS